MTNSLTVAGVQAMLDASPYIRGTGMKVVRLDANALEIAVELAMRPEFERRAGTGQWHGGPIAALIDTAGDYALALHAGGAGADDQLPDGLPPPGRRHLAHRDCPGAAGRADGRSGRHRRDGRLRKAGRGRARQLRGADGLNEGKGGAAR